ncbi:MAG: hypothetical protein OXL35_00155 [Chloroflexota bacterium]|nr:hypothetical protein [Chloroflexota bacterium]
MLSLSREPREFPDQDLLERGVGLAGLVDHLLELGSVSYPPALSLVYVLAGYGVAILVGVFSESPQLGGYGEVHVLAVT